MSLRVGWDGWDGMDGIGMVIIGHRYSKGTFGANNGKFLRCTNPDLRVIAASK